MRVSILCSMIGLVFSSPSFACEVEGRLAKLQKHLGLQDQQVEQIQDTFFDVVDQKDCWKVEDKRACYKEMRGAIRENIKAILTEEQQLKFKELRLEFKQQRRRRLREYFRG